MDPAVKQSRHRWAGGGSWHGTVDAFRVHFPALAHEHYGQPAVAVRAAPPEDRDDAHISALPGLPDTAPQEAVH